MSIPPLVACLHPFSNVITYSVLSYCRAYNAFFILVLAFGNDFSEVTFKHLTSHSNISPFFGYPSYMAEHESGAGADTVVQLTRYGGFISIICLSLSRGKPPHPPPNTPFSAGRVDVGKLLNQRKHRAGHVDHIHFLALHFLRIMPADSGVCCAKKY